MRAPELIDAAISHRVLVFGSLPPEGRDLDLLVREDEKRAISTSLTQAGFVRKASEWARFASCSVEIVELVDAASWALSATELDALFDDALIIEGLHNVVRPSPPHALLILAQRIACGDGVLDEKRRSRLQQALAEDPDVWARARTMAPGWSATEAIDALEGLWRTGNRIPAAQRTAARRERQIAREGPAGARARVASAVGRISQLRRGAVVALSGLDGAGKSSQAAALCDVLEHLGYKVIVVRTRIAWDDSLWTVTGPIKRLLRPPLRLLTTLRPPSAPRPRPIAREQPDEGNDALVPDQPLASDPVTLVRESSPLLTDLWTLVITLANASLQWKLMRRELLRGYIVICDRYTLDSIVELRYSYGTERRYRGARAAMSTLYPKPVRAFFLDVSPQAALARKGEWGMQWLSEHREIYLEECERLGVRLLDGELPPADICDEIAREVWLSDI